MHNIVSESHRVARTYVGIFDWLVSYAVCELSFDGPNMTNSSGRMVKPESGIRNRSRKRNRNRNLNWDQGKLGSTETSSRYPCGNKIQDGVLCYHCFEKFSAQWSWYQRYTHRAKELTFGYLVHACVLLYQTCLHITLRHFYQKKKQTNKQNIQL